MAIKTQESFLIEGPARLKGEVLLSGSKNASFPVLSTSILSDGEMIFNNVPKSADVALFIQILEIMGAKVNWLGHNRLSINCRDINPKKLDQKLVSKLRGSIVLIGPLLARFNLVEICEPGGCYIGVRSIDTHINAFIDLGVKVEKEPIFEDGLTKGYKYVFSFNLNDLSNEVMLEEFSVTASENIILFASGLKSDIKIWGAAREPHVVELCDILSDMGATITMAGSNIVQIRGKSKLSPVNHSIRPDYLEAGTFAIASALTHSQITIKPFPYDDLRAVLVVFKKMGIPWRYNDNTQEFAISDISAIKPTTIKTGVHPAFPSDLQSPFGVLATQAQGTTLLFETLYEGRLKYLSELQKFGANIIIADTHRALITGPTPFLGAEIESLDIRAGATMILASLIAKGKTLIRNAGQIDRGYENFDGKLRALGVNIKRISENI